MHEFKQNPVRIAMDYAFHGRVRVVADGVGTLIGVFDQFVGARHILGGNRVRRIIHVDQRTDRRRQRNGVARGNGVEGCRLFRADEAIRYEITNTAQGRLSQDASPPLVPRLPGRS